MNDFSGQSGQLGHVQFFPTSGFPGGPGGQVSPNALQYIPQNNTTLSSPQTASTSETGSTIVKPFQTNVVVTPLADSQGIFFAQFSQIVYNSPVANIVGGGHIAGSINWGVLFANTTIAMGIGSEGRYDHLNGITGTTTQAKAVLGLINNAGGTMTNAKGLASEINNTALITNGYGVYVDVPVNTGTITNYTYFGSADLSLIAGIGTKRFFNNLDGAAPALSVAPIIDQSYGFSAPATGFALTIPANIQYWFFFPAGTLATGTVTFPAAPLDGQELTLSTNNTITALTLNGNGFTISGAATTLTASTPIGYKFVAKGINIWMRIK